MQEQPNIIFLMLDTVRADVLSTYGGELELKTIDGLSKKGIVYENAISSGTYTLPSHLSLFLGKRPRSIEELKHDNMKNYNQGTDPFLIKSKYIKENEITLAEHLDYLGYDTALFSNNPFLSPASGITKGFYHVQNTFVDSKIKGGRPHVKVLLKIINNDMLRNNAVRLSVFLSGIFSESAFDNVYVRLRKSVDRHYAEECGYYNIDSGAEQTNQKVKKHLIIAGGGPHFLFLNYMEGHEGYPTNLITGKHAIQDKWLHMVGHTSRKDIEIEKKAYLKRITYLDGKVSELLKHLKSHGKLYNAYVIVTSDHGQAFMEHGQMYHNVFPYNEVIKVPLIISKFEKGEQVDIGKRIKSPFSLDMLNRIIRDMALAKEPEFDRIENEVVVSDHLGITEVWDTYLLRKIKSRSEHADKIYRMKSHFNQFATAIYYKNYKLIHFEGEKEDEMYMLDDIKEKKNIIDKNQLLAKRMLKYDSLLA